MPFSDERFRVPLTPPEVLTAPLDIPFFEKPGASNQSSEELVPFDWAYSRSAELARPIFDRMAKSEGEILVPYKDSEGNITVGVGHRIKAADIDRFLLEHGRVLDKGNEPDRPANAEDVRREASRLRSITTSVYRTAAYTRKLYKESGEVRKKALFDRLYIDGDSVSKWLASDSKDAWKLTDSWAGQVGGKGYESRRQGRVGAGLPPGVVAVVNDINFNCIGGMKKFPKFTALAISLVRASSMRDRVRILDDMAIESVLNGPGKNVERNELHMRAIRDDADRLLNRRVQMFGE